MTPRVVPRDERRELQEKMHAVTLRARERAAGGSDGPYGVTSSRSWFLDLLYGRASNATRSHLPPPPNIVGGEIEARQRLSQVERRDLSTTATAGGGFTGTGSVPGYVADEFSRALRSKATIAGLLNQRPLPESGMTVTTPRLTTGTATAAQASEGAGNQETDIVEALISSAVATLEGQQDVSIQLFQRAEGPTGPGFDAVLAADLGSSLAATLENQIVGGTGTAPQLRGLANAVGLTSVVKTNASPTAITDLKAIADLVRQAAEFYGAREGLVALMALRRLAFIQGTLGYSPDWPATPVGASAVRTTIATSQDEVFVFPPDEITLLTSAAEFGVHPEPLSSTLTVRFVTSMYAAMLTSRVGPALVYSTGTEWASPSW